MILNIAPLADCDPEIGRMLWMLEDARRETRHRLEGIQPAALDWQHNGNSIGTLLYHIAIIEMDWLVNEVMEGKMPEAVWKDFPYDVRNDKGILTPVSGLSLDEHYRRMDTTRAHLLDTFRPMTVTEFRRMRHLSAYDVTPEWVLHHLMQHEAEHRGEIATVRTMAEKALGIN